LGQIFWTVEFGDWRVCSVEEDGLEECERILALALGGGGEREVYGKRLGAVEGLTAEGDLAEDDGEQDVPATFSLYMFLLRHQPALALAFRLAHDLPLCNSLDLAGAGGVVKKGS
jgi:hypothetical protein